MNMIRYEPWSALRDVHNELERFLGGSGLDNGDRSRVVTGQWVPAVDIREDTDHYVIQADIPGVDPKDIEVTMENGVLSIRGERKFEDRQEGEGYSRVERARGTFYRRFSMPDSADADKISAQGKNGVLEINIPKKETVQPRRIQVK